MAGDGSRWRWAEWESCEVTVREHNANSKWTSTDLMVKEMESLSVLRHPNILLLMATCCGPTKQDLLLVVEPVEPYSLFQLLHQFKESRILRGGKRMNIACGMTSGELKVPE